MSENLLTAIVLLLYNFHNIHRLYRNKNNQYNMQRRHITMAKKNGATAGKFDLAKRAKELNLDAIHDTVHEMARDEARHGKAFEGLLKRYFG